MLWRVVMGGGNVMFPYERASSADARLMIPVRSTPWSLNSVMAASNASSGWGLRSSSRQQSQLPPRTVMSNVSWLSFTAASKASCETRFFTAIAKETIVMAGGSTARSLRGVVQLCLGGCVGTESRAAPLIIDQTRHIFLQTQYSVGHGPVCSGRKCQPL